MITPAEIQNQRFKKSFRGYSENEVDDFLDRITADYEKLMHENEKLKEDAIFATRELEQYKRLEKNLQDTLDVAQKTANEVIENAKKNAKEMRDNAVRDTQRIYESTTKDAQQIRDEAELDAKRKVDEVTYKLRNAVSEYNRIVREKNTFLLKLRTALESELAVTLHLLSSVPVNAEVSPAPPVAKSTEEKKISESKPEQVKVEKVAEEKKSVPTIEKKSDPEDLEKTSVYEPVKRSE